MKEKTLIFFGAPGAGKGTQAKKISTSLNIPHIDTGNLIRDAIKNQTGLGMKAKEFVETGKLVPDKLVIDLIRKKLLVLKDKNSSGFILDGYPRTIPQAEALEEITQELNITPPKVINVQAPEELLIKRLSSRRLCSSKSCGEIYNLISKKPKVENKCDLCSSPLYQRKDDKKEAAQERLKEYHNKTAPLEDYYRKQKKLFDINGAKDPNEVYNEILKIVMS